MKKKIAIAVHGGAGTILKSSMTPALEKAYKAALEAALQSGYKILGEGGSSLDAVEMAVKVLEDCPLYNAGKGSVFTANETNELDASIMSGKDLMAGAVAGVTTIKNPVAAARAVMEKSGHVLLMGKGAEDFAASQGLVIVTPDYYFTTERWEALQRVKKNSPDTMELDHDGSALLQRKKKEEKFGTVGAVALDADGNVAAATSTGGMTNKKWGRVGDTPLIGAGTYANHLCAVSCTGSGEYFIRLCVAKAVADLMEYKEVSLEKAARLMIFKKLASINGDGGLIAIDKKGTITMPFNTEGMYRGYINTDGQVKVKIYK